MSGTGRMAVKHLMSIDATIIETEERSRTTFSLSVATSNSLRIAGGERCRAYAPMHGRMSGVNNGVSWCE